MATTITANCTTGEIKTRQITPEEDAEHNTTRTAFTAITAAQETRQNTTNGLRANIIQDYMSIAGATGYPADKAALLRILRYLLRRAADDV